MDRGLVLSSQSIDIEGVQEPHVASEWKWIKDKRQ